jgi:hypothetical protein
VTASAAQGRAVQRGDVRPSDCVEVVVGSLTSVQMGAQHPIERAAQRRARARGVGGDGRGRGEVPQLLASAGASSPLRTAKVSRSA